MRNLLIGGTPAHLHHRHYFALAIEAEVALVLGDKPHIRTEKRLRGNIAVVHGNSMAVHPSVGRLRVTLPSRTHAVGIHITLLIFPAVLQENIHLGTITAGHLFLRLQPRRIDAIILVRHFQSIIKHQLLGTLRKRDTHRHLAIRTVHRADRLHQLTQVYRTAHQDFEVYQPQHLHIINFRVQAGTPAAAGTLLGPSNGEFVTDRNGQIILEDLEPGVTITAKETKTVDGFVLDGTPQSILIKEGEAQQLTFFNKRAGGVEIIKVNEADQTERIPNVTFEIRQMDGGLVDTVTTDSQGRVYVELEAGDYYAVEIQAGEGFQVDSTPHYFTVKDNETTTLTVTNKAFSGIIIHKIDSVTEEGIYGVKFVLYDSSKKPIGEYTTDDEGYIYIDDLPMSGRFYLRELEAAEGYTLDKEYKTVNVQAGKTVHIEWENTAVTGQIQIYKYAAEYNEVTGAAPGTPLEGAVYEIVHERSGKVVDYITTDVRGVAASKPLPLGRYKIVEVTAPAYWQVDATVHDVTLEFPGQIIKLSAYDKPSSLGVTLTKRGNAEVLAGNQMRYDITVANTSNVPLENFYWHDRIPTDVSRATVLTTGTYSARLNYRILYKTNYSASYQVLASNLLTSNSYSFALNAIPTQAGEVVTDVFFDFGKVPVGFQSVTGPTLTVVINGDAVNGYQLVNRADAGGKYQGTWQTAQASWVTIIKRLGDVPALPKTGY